MHAVLTALETTATKLPRQVQGPLGEVRHWCGELEKLAGDAHDLRVEFVCKRSQEARRENAHVEHEGLVGDTGKQFPRGLVGGAGARVTRKRLQLAA